MRESGSELISWFETVYTIGWKHFKEKGGIPGETYKTYIAIAQRFSPSDRVAVKS